MTADNSAPGADQPLRYDTIRDPEFEKKWRNARHLTGEEVELAFRHGLEAIDRFAERPFSEVEDYLRQSWDAMAPPVPWDQVSDIVQSGYERYKGSEFEPTVDEVSEALARFPHRTIGGTSIGGVIGERPFLGASEPVSDYDGEGGPPVEDGRRVTE